jgi:hypothetical protein
MAGDVLDPGSETNENFEASLRNLGLGEEVGALIEEKIPTSSNSEDAADITKVRGTLAAARADYDDEVVQPAAQRSRIRSREAEARENAKRNRRLLSLAGLGIALAGAWAWLRGVEARDVKPDETIDRTPARESIYQDPNVVNEALKANIDNDNNVDGLGSVTADEGAAVNAADVNQAVKDNLEAQRAADDAGKPIEDGLDTEKLE